MAASPSAPSLGETAALQKGDVVLGRLRVGLVSYDFDPPIGGQGVEAKAFAGFLRASCPNIELFVIAAAIGAHGQGMQIGTSAQRGAELRFSAHFALKMDRLVKRFRLDCLLVYGGPGGVVLLRTSKIPVIYIANHTYHAQAELQGDRLAYRVLKRLECRGYQRAAHTICISKSTRDELQEHYGIEPARLSIVPPTMDLSAFFAIDRPGNPRRVLFVGRLHPRKNVASLLQAAKKLKEAGTPAAIQVIGDGPLRDSLELLAIELKIEAEFLGRCSDERVVAAIEEAGILCLPSHFEGFGIVLAEAMAAGRVVLGADAPGIRDVVPDQNLLFAPDHPEELAQILSRFIGNPEAQRAMGAELRHRAWESYRLEKTGRQILDVIYRVCRRGAEAGVVGS